MREVISGSDGGKRLMNELVDGIDKLLKDQDYQDAIDAFNEDLNDITDNTDDDDLSDFLGGLGIKLSDD